MKQHDLEREEDGDVYCKTHSKYVITVSRNKTYFNEHSCIDENIQGETAE